MVKLHKIKKRNLFFFIFIIVCLVYGIFHSKNYEMEYSVENVHIIEKFNKQEKTYEFLFKIKEKEFFVALEHNDIHSKKIIKRVEVKEKDGNLCILPQSKALNLYPLCFINNEYVSYHLIEEEDLIDSSYQKEIVSEEKSFHNIKIYDLNDKIYYIWNYEGFYILSNQENKEIKLFKEDIYNLPLVMKVNQNLLVADYDAKYAFNKFYVINSKKDKVKEMNLEKEISFESYFLGSANKKAYLVDKKNKIEYEINPQKLRIENITKNNQGRILNQDVWEPVSMNLLVSKDMNFTHNTITEFKIENNTLYKVQGNYQTKISNQSVKDIIYFEKDTVYYLVGEKLYYYNDTDGEVLVLSNFEWNFNYKNMIYIF